MGARNKKGPTTRLSGIRDGADMTIMLSENIHKTYDPASPGQEPRLTWLYGNEQQVGMVWVVPSIGTSPAAGQLHGESGRHQSKLGR